MLGLLYILAAIIYGIVLIVVTGKAYRWGLSKWGRPKAYLTGLGGFLLIYLPVFWDRIPTLIAHQYYCSTQADFKIFKTLEQWKQENPEVVKALVPYEEGEKSIAIQNGSLDFINQRFVNEFQKVRYQILPITRITVSIKDTKNGEVLAQQVNFRSGYGNMMTAIDVRSLKFWLHETSCPIESARSDFAEFSQYKAAIKKIGN